MHLGLHTAFRRSILKEGLFLLLCLFVFNPFSFSQQGKNTLGNPMPDFSIYTVKDSTEFKSSTIKKKGIILIKVFSPDCEHCQQEAKEYYSHKEDLKNIKTIWISGSWTPMKAIEEFIAEYHIDELNPIAIGKENESFLLNYFGIDGIPYAALYIHDQLVFAQKGELDFEELIAIASGNYEE